MVQNNASMLRKVRHKIARETIAICDQAGKLDLTAQRDF